MNTWKMIGFVALVWGTGVLTLAAWAYAGKRRERKEQPPAEPMTMVYIPQGYEFCVPGWVDDQSLARQVPDPRTAAIDRMVDSMTDEQLDRLLADVFREADGDGG